MIFCLEKQVEKALGTKGLLGERGSEIKEGNWPAQKELSGFEGLFVL